MRKALALTIAIGALAGAFSFAQTATAAETEAAMIDRVFLQPHHSPITGAMVVSLREWYGIQPLWTLSILGAETSMGDPVLGGRLVGYNNFGCMRAGDATTKWGMLASGTVSVAGRVWWRFPSPLIGMMAWGRLIKLEYLPLLQQGGVSGAYGKYYGREVAGFATHLAELRQIEKSVAAKARAAGWDW